MDTTINENQIPCVKKQINLTTFERIPAWGKKNMVNVETRNNINNG